MILLGIVLSINFNLIWIIKFIEYIGYFILGYSLRGYYSENIIKPYKFIIGAIICSIMIFVCTELIVRNDWLKGMQLGFYKCLSPFVIIGAISLYIGFLNMKNIKINVTGLSKHTFNIYLIHAGLLDVLTIIMSKLTNMSINPLIYIPIMTLVILGLSYLGSILIERMLKILKNKLVLFKDKKINIQR